LRCEWWTQTKRWELSLTRISTLKKEKSVHYVNKNLERHTGDIIVGYVSNQFALLVSRELVRQRNVTCVPLKKKIEM
jgi:hypothetical protein